MQKFLGTILILVFTLSLSITTMSQAQTAVNLGSTANFVILAGSLVSNIPTSSVTGDIGLSPAAGSGITGFGAMEVSGLVYTVDATGPAGSTIAAALLTAAKGDLTIAFNDAAGRVPVPTGTFLNPGSGNIGGMTLVPGLYKFTSSASITGNDVTLTGNATAVWIFQIAADLNVGTGVKVILAGGAKAANIFWQVGTSATLGTTSVFKGTIMADQSISIGTGASLEGRALAASAAVTLASNVITKPSSVTAVKTSVMPQEFALTQNFPNPFNPSTMIHYSLEDASQVTLKIYNLVGEEVASLVNANQSAGDHTVQFNSQQQMRTLSSGVYFYRLEARHNTGGQAGAFISTKKMILMK